MSYECAMCEEAIKTSKPIFVMTDTLFLPSGRWSDHLTTENYCSLKCATEVMEGAEGEGLQDKEGAECSVCSSKFLAGHTVTLGWCKTQRERWHKTITTRNYCSHDCLQKDFADPKSPLAMEVPKKPAKKRKTTKKKTTTAKKKPATKKKAPAKKRTTTRKKKKS